MPRITTILSRCVIAFLLTLWLVAADAAGQTSAVRIGMAKSFLYEKPKSYVDIAADEFKEVLKEITGLDGELDPKFSASEVADKLQNKQIDFGVFHAHEFAWVQKKHPDLEPMLVAINKQHAERAYLIGHVKSGAKAFADLRGKKLDIPVGNSEPTRMFLAKRAADLEPKGMASYFRTIAKSASVHEALDDLARGKVDVVLVNATGLEFYKEVRGPVFAKNMKVILQSDPFPPSVIVRRKGEPAEAKLKQFRDGLLKAHTTQLGREMMKTWNIDTFESVPADYAARLTEVLKAYPAPDSKR